ncbi:unnamed protein product [Arabidopsis lyrata]|nr:unnamed protein product [Arabidopsis lyrata]
MRIKLPPRDSAGVVTAFYLTSKGNTHDEVDFEFLGNRQGKPTAIQTNVFTNGQGGLRGQSSYCVYVDKVPIRVFKNNKRSGVNYPSKPMQLETSLWNGEAWATNGGKDKINWAYAPFKAQFQGFSDYGCHVNGQSNIANVCGSTKYWWNTRTYSRLSANEQKAMENVRAKYMNYDYCSDRPRYPVPPSECRWNI